MFQDRDRWVRCCSSALLFALSIAILNGSPYRLFADDKPSQLTAHVAKTPKKAEAERPPFDLTYVPPDAMGVIAIRPSAIFADPAMKPLAGIVNQYLAGLWQALKLSPEPKLAIEDIEEIVIGVTIKVGDKKHGRNHSLMAWLSMVRTKHDFDWLKLMRQIDPETEEVRHDDRVYYRGHPARLIPDISPKATNSFFIPDKRTLAFPEGKSMSAFADGQDIQRPQFAWDKDWKRVEHGLIAVAIDNRWTNGLSAEEIGGVHPVCTALAQIAATMTAGVDWKDGIDFRAFLSCKDRAEGDRIVEFVKFLLAGLRDATKQRPKDAPQDDWRATAFLMQMCKELSEHAHIRQSDTTVRVHTTAKLNLADVAKCLFSEPEPTVIVPRK